MKKIKVLLITLLLLLSLSACGDQEKLEGVIMPAELDTTTANNFLDKFVGKTIKDLEKRGYYLGNFYEQNSDGSQIYFYEDTGTYLATIDPISEDDFYNLSEDDRNALTIKKFELYSQEEEKPETRNLFEDVEVSETVKQSPLYEYYSNGYYEKTSSWDTKKLSLYLTNNKKYIYALLPINEEISDKIGKVTSENYEVETALILCEITNVQVNDVTDLIPTKDKLNEYIWGDVNELIKDGYKYQSHEKTDDFSDVGYVTLSDGVATLSVSVESNLSAKQFNDLSKGEVCSLNIIEVQFVSLDYEYDPFASK